MQKHCLQITSSPKLLNDHDTHTFAISYIPVLINVNINSSGSCGGNNITPGTQAVRLKKKIKKWQKVASNRTVGLKKFSLGQKFSRKSNTQKLSAALLWWHWYLQRSSMFSDKPRTNIRSKRTKCFNEMNLKYDREFWQSASGETSARCGENALTMCKRVSNRNVSADTSKHNISHSSALLRLNLKKNTLNCIYFCLLWFLGFTEPREGKNDVIQLMMMVTCMLPQPSCVLTF